MKLFLVRHTESFGNKIKVIDSTSPKYDKGLSEQGKKQAKELIPKLKKYKFDLFIVSPLTRTIDTIKPYLETIDNPKVIVSKLILERNAGDFIGQKLGYAKKYMQEHSITNPVSFRFPKGESLLEVYERAKKFLQSLKNKYPDKNILISGHSMFLRCLKIAINNEDINKIYSLDSIQNGEIWKFNIN